MKKLPVLLAALVLSLSLVACSTIESRIKENSAAFAAASPRDQALMKKGLLGRGFTPAMVVIAIDVPDTITKSPDGHAERWIYKNFDTGGGNFTMGKPQVGVNNPGTSVQQKQNYLKNTYSTRNDPSGAVDATQQHLVLEFKDNKLVAMEMLSM